MDRQRTILSLLVFSYFGQVNAQCSFYKKNCHFKDNTGVFCYLSGNDDEPKLDEVLSQNYTSIDEQIGCPNIFTPAVPFVVFLGNLFCL